jgi:hypothetical protein
LRAAAIAFVAALAPLAAVAAQTRWVAPAAAAPTPPGCTTSGLVVWLDTQGDGTAGSIYYKLKFTNLSGHACTIRGYPGVSAVDLGGHQLGSSASHDSVHAPRSVQLTNGATASAVLRIVDVGVLSPSACHQVTAAGLRVHPPGRLTAKYAPFPFSACSRSGPIYLITRAVQKG